MTSRSPKAPDDGPDPLGKRALFWAPAGRTDDAPDTRPAGKRALFSAYSEPDPPRPAARPRRRAAPAPAAEDGRGGFGRLWLQCGTCGGRRAVDLLTYARLHLPVFVVRPGRGFTRFMTCPTCRRRTWLSVSWKPPGG